MSEPLPRFSADWWDDRLSRLLPIDCPGLVSHMLAGLTFNGGLLVLPVLVAITTGGWLFGRDRWQRARNGEMYLIAAQRALRQDDVDTARVCFERLVQMDGGLPQSRFGLACALDRLGERERAVRLMAQIAPLARPGYLRAHLWFARQLLAQSTTPGAERQLGTHLEHALALDARHPEAHYLAARMHGRRGDVAAAIPHLERAAAANPRWKLMLAKYLRMRASTLRKSDPSLAKLASVRAALQIREARVALRAQIKEHPRRHQLRIDLAEAEALDRRWEVAERLLLEGLKTAAGDEPAYRRVLAQLYLARHADAVRRDTSVAEQVHWLIAGLSQQPQHLQLLGKIVAVGRRDDAVGVQTRSLLRSLIVRSKVGPFAHFALGSIELARGNTVAARRHLELAYDRRPLFDPTAARLATVLLDAGADLGRAEALVQRALGARPGHPPYLAIRGRVRLAQQRYKEAVRDLRVAASARRDDAQVQALLAQAYAKLELPELARAHTREARRLLAAGRRP